MGAQGVPSHPDEVDDSEKKWQAVYDKVTLQALWLDCWEAVYKVTLSNPDRDNHPFNKDDHIESPDLQDSA